MRRIPEAWRQGGQIATGIAAELGLALGFCVLGLLVCAVIGAIV